MKFETYLNDALRSEQPLQAVFADREALIAILETAVAMANAIDLLKKYIVYGRPYDNKAMAHAMLGVSDAATTARRYSAIPVPYTQIPVNPRLLHAALGTFGEAGETFHALLRQIDDKGELDIFNVKEECGDKFWYAALELSEIAALDGTAAGEILAANVAKLQVRYPDKFTLIESDGRDVAAEYAAMKESGEAA